MARAPMISVATSREMTIEVSTAMILAKGQAEQAAPEGVRVTAPVRVLDPEEVKVWEVPARIQALVIMVLASAGM